jgi:preprotein translocase subunit SecG
MTLVFIILVLLIAVVLGFLVLIQSPKGGGLASNVGGIGNNLMGVKQTNDVLEKGTWIFVTALALICLFSSVFIGKLNKPQVQKAPTEQKP